MRHRHHFENIRAAAPRQLRWYRGPIVRGRRSVLGVGLAAAAASALLTGCGGGTRQDASERGGSFQLKVVNASFPVQQVIARPTKLELQVRNTGTHTVANVAVTVDSFNYTSNYPKLAADKRPIWAIEQGPGAIASPPVQSQEVSVPGGGQTAYVNTWALGALAPGQTQTFAWHVMPLKPGMHTVSYTVDAGLAGKAKAVLASGGPVKGHFTVDISSAPPAMHVDPSTGRIVPGASPSYSSTP